MFARREVLQVGCSSFLGVGLTNLSGQEIHAATQTPRRVKSVVLVFLTGGGSHLDTFDPKPESSNVKGEFGPIGTAIAGVQFTEKMTGLAARAGQLALVRSMSHGDNRHLSGTHNTLTGAEQVFRGTSNEAKSLNRADWPAYGSALAKLRPRHDHLPTQVTLPNPLVEGVLVWPAQHAGFLGPKYDPFLLKDDPNGKDYRVRGLSLIDGLSVSRLKKRRQLVEGMDRSSERVGASPSRRKYAEEQQMAYSLLTSSQLKSALDIRSETAKARDRYGRHTYGQTLLLARRLVEMEMPVIQCNMGIVQSWDTHVNHFPRLKSMLPALDAGLSALLDDLSDRGLMKQTLVVCVGEFGRTPTISPLPGQKIPGRHHWAHGYTAVFAGGGVQGGQVIGQTDKTGGHPVTTAFHPNDMGATVYSALGIDPHTMITDRLGRPRRLNQGKVIESLYSAAPT